LNVIAAFAFATFCATIPDHPERTRQSGSDREIPPSHY